jgi:hypothetical protein
MLRACRKTTLHMRELKSPYFDEAFFILRRDMPRGSAATLSEEAERIAAECSDPHCAARRRRREVTVKAALFIGGALAGALFSVGIMLCLGRA